MNNANMVGDLPPELSALWALKRLIIHQNKLTGPLPALNFEKMDWCSLLFSKTSFTQQQQQLTQQVENKFPCPFPADVMTKCRFGDTGINANDRTSNSQCVAVCSAGEYATDKQACVACPGGKFTSSRVQLKCDVCPSGKYQLASSANQSSCPGVGATNCTGDKSTNARSGATGGSENLPADQCNAWIKTYDSTGGPLWEKCKDARTDPCSCMGSSTTSYMQYTCSQDGTAIEQM
jgi:hypothetical protein